MCVVCDAWSCRVWCVCCDEFVWRPDLCVWFGVPTWRPELGGVQNGGVQRVPNELFIKVWDPVHTSVHTCAHTCTQCVHSV